MNRKDFLRQSVFATGLLISNRIMAGVHGKQADCARTLKGYTSFPDNGNKFFTVSLLLCVDAINFHKDAKPEDKVATLSLFHCDENGKTAERFYKASYIIQPPVLLPKQQKGPSTYKVKLIQKTVEEEAKFRLPAGISWKQFEMDFTFNNNTPFYYAKLKGSDLKYYMDLEADPGEGCFITTACVKAMGKTDFCEELMQMRELRDAFMRKDEEGKVLIDEYYAIAPAMVVRIDAMLDAAAVWQKIYHDMIMPTLHFYKAGDCKKAMYTYRDYTHRLFDQLFVPTALSVS